MNAPHHQGLGSWLSLIDYAVKKGVSVSTLRRHIKAQKLPFKVESGRYLIWDGEFNYLNLNIKSPVVTQASSFEELKETIGKLEQDLQKAQEEIAELKTLIAFYEEKMPHDRIVGF